MLSLKLISWQIYIFSCFKEDMFVTGIQPYNYTYRQNLKQPSFKGIKPIDLNYVLKNRAYLLPERVRDKVSEIVKLNLSDVPSLKQVHKEVYAPLLVCNTLNDAKRLFPEFAGMKEAGLVFQRNSGNIKRLNANGHLHDNLSLKLLRDVWVNLKSQDEIAEELGLKGRSALGWVLKKINFVSYSSNYRTLLMSSDPETRALIAAKTTAWNTCHPDLMYKKNKHAAQFCKTPEYRKAHSERMIEYDKLHPERREKIRNFNLEVWKHVPEIKAAMSEFAKSQNVLTKSVMAKEMSGVHLTSFEKRIKKSFYKKFWQSNPDLKKRFKEAHRQVREELTVLKNGKNSDKKV